MANLLGDYEKISEEDGFDLYGYYVAHRQAGPFSTYYVLAVKDEDGKRVGFCQMVSAFYLVEPSIHQEERESYLQNRALDIVRERIANDDYSHNENYEYRL